MNRRATIFKLTVLIVFAIAVTSCNGIKKMATKYNTVTYQVTPEVMETIGGKVTVTVNGEIPPKYFNKRAAVCFAPELVYQNGTTPLKTIVLKGEKVKGEGTTVNYKEGGKFSFTDEFSYKPDMNASELKVTPVAFKARTEMPAGLKLEDAKAMPKSIVLGETKLADGVIYTSTRIEIENELRQVIEIGDDNIQKDAKGNINYDAYKAKGEEVEMLFLAPHGYEKVTLANQKASVYFAKNLHAYNESLKWNKQEDMKGQLEKLNNFVRQGWVIKDVVIDGWASPEGEETYNSGLSENRAKTAANVLYDHFAKMVKEKDSKVAFKNPKTDINITTVGHGPDWNSFPGMVEKSSVKDKGPILNVVKSSDPLKREEEIRNMILIYPELEETILPPLRRATISITCFEPKKTDQEIASLATSDPSQLTEAELLYAGTLTEDLDTKYKIYKAAATNFPNGWKGQNNAGYVAMKLGKTDEAKGYFQKAEGLDKNNGMVVNNLGVALATKGNYTEAETYLVKANKMGIQNNYNLGLIDLTKGDFKGALAKFGTTKCNYHVALAQVITGNNSAAASNLECARKNGATYYLLAVVGARTNNEALMMTNLKKAIKANGKYRAQAAEDREFIKYFGNAEFQGIVK